MPTQLNLLGHDVAIEDTPSLPQTSDKPGKALVFTDKATGNQVFYAMDGKTAHQIGKDLLGYKLVSK